MSRIWEEVTGDSFVVDVSRIRSGARSARYCSKYMVKSFRDRESMEALGFKRRWSRSRNWPSGFAMQLRGTAEKRWVRTQILPGADLTAFPDPKEELKCYWLEQVGTDLALELYGARKNAAIVADVKGRLDEYTKALLPTYSPDPGG